MPTIDINRNNAIPFTQDQLEKMASMYRDQGRSIRQISEVFGISQPAVTARLNAMKIEIRRRGRYTEATESVISSAIELYSSGLTWAEIGKKLGFDRQHISWAVRNHKAQNENSLPL